MPRASPDCTARVEHSPNRPDVVGDGSAARNSLHDRRRRTVAGDPISGDRSPIELEPVGRDVPVPGAELSRLHGHAKPIVAQLQCLERVAPIGRFALQLAVLALELGGSLAHQTLQPKRPEQRRRGHQQRRTPDLGRPPEQRACPRSRARRTTRGEPEHHGLRSDHACGGGHGEDSPDCIREYLRDGARRRRRHDAANGSATAVVRRDGLAPAHRALTPRSACIRYRTRRLLTLVSLAMFAAPAAGRRSRPPHRGRARWHREDDLRLARRDLRRRSDVHRRRARTRRAASTSGSWTACRCPG